jgi:hypothetical protein
MLGLKEMLSGQCIQKTFMMEKMASRLTIMFNGELTIRGIMFND